MTSRPTTPMRTSGCGCDGPAVRVLSVAPGPEEHGVVRHALTVARLLSAVPGVQVTTTRSLDLPAGAYDVTHVQFTDALFGTDVAGAARAFEAWSARAPRPLVVTLHDVPGADPDPGRDARRREGYRRVLAQVDAVVVSWAREARDARLVDGLHPVVVPLPVEPLAAPGAAPGWADRSTVGVLGFVYPGKGHAEALEAVARSGLRATVVALGGPSAGHEPLVAQLHRRAESLGVELLVTGSLSEPDLHAAARATSVPLAAYRTLGASASIATWIAAARRPLVLPSAYVLDHETSWPGALLVAQEDLPSALAAAMGNLSSTWSTSAAPRPDVAAAHLAVLRSVTARAAAA